MFPGCVEQSEQTTREEPHQTPESSLLKYSSYYTIEKYFNSDEKLILAISIDSCDSCPTMWNEIFAVIKQKYPNWQIDHSESYEQHCGYASATTFALVYLVPLHSEDN